MGGQEEKYSIYFRLSKLMIMVTQERFEPGSVEETRELLAVRRSSLRGVDSEVANAVMSGVKDEISMALYQEVRSIVRDEMRIDVDKSGGGVDAYLFGGVIIRALEGSRVVDKHTGKDLKIEGIKFEGLMNKRVGGIFDKIKKRTQRLKSIREEARSRMMGVVSDYLLLVQDELIEKAEAGELDAQPQTVAA